MEALILSGLIILYFIFDILEYVEHQKFGVKHFDEWNDTRIKRSVNNG